MRHPLMRSSIRLSSPQNAIYGLELEMEKRIELKALLTGWEATLGKLKPKESWIYKRKNYNFWCVRIIFNENSKIYESSIRKLNEMFMKVVELNSEAPQLIRNHGDLITFYQGNSLFDVFEDGREKTYQLGKKIQKISDVETPDTPVRKKFWFNKLSYKAKMRIALYSVLEVLSVISLISDNFNIQALFLGNDLVIEPIYYVNGFLIPICEIIMALYAGYCEFCQERTTLNLIIKRFVRITFFLSVLTNYVNWVMNPNGIVEWYSSLATVMGLTFIYSLYLFYLNNSPDGERKHRNLRIFGMVALFCVYIIGFAFIDSILLQNSSGIISYFCKSYWILNFTVIYPSILIVFMLFFNLRDYKDPRQFHMNNLRRKGIIFMLIGIQFFVCLLSAGQYFVLNLQFSNLYVSYYNFWFYPGILILFHMAKIRKMKSWKKNYKTKLFLLIKLFLLSELIVLSFDFINLWTGNFSNLINNFNSIFGASQFLLFNLWCVPFVNFFVGIYDENMNFLSNQTSVRTKLRILLSFLIFQFYLFNTNYLLHGNSGQIFENFLTSSLSFVDGGMMPVILFFYLLYSDYRLFVVSDSEKRIYRKRAEEIKDMLPNLIHISINVPSLEYCREIGRSSFMTLRNMVIWVSLIPVLYHLVVEFSVDITITYCYYIDSGNTNVPIRLGQCVDCLNSTTFNKNLWENGPGIPIALYSLVFIFLILTTLRRIKILHKYRVILIGAGFRFKQPRLNELNRFLLMILLLGWLGFFNYLGISNDLAVSTSMFEGNCTFLGANEVLYVGGSDMVSTILQQLVGYLPMFSLIYLELRNSTLRYFREGEHIELLNYPIKIKYEMDVGPSLCHLEEVRKFFLTLNNYTVEEKTKIIIGHFYEKNMLRVTDEETIVA